MKKWLSETSHSRVTDADIAELLGVTRKTANRRINDGLNATDLITVCRALEVNPVDALVELGHLEDEEVMAYMDADGRLLDNASESEIALELARRLNPATLADTLADIARTPERLKNLDGQDVARALLLLQQEITRRTDGLNAMLELEGVEPITEQQAVESLTQDTQVYDLTRRNRTKGGTKTTPAATDALYAANRRPLEPEEGDDDYGPGA